MFICGLFTSILGTCDTSSTKAHDVHAWWGTTHFSRRCHTVPEHGFRGIVVTRADLTIAWIYFSAFSTVGTPKDCVVLSADQWLLSITGTRRECRSGFRSEARKFGQSAHVCVQKSWKLCWASHVWIAGTSSLPQQALVSGHVWNGNVYLF
jgi:hypothetical protein